MLVLLRSTGCSARRAPPVPNLISSASRSRSLAELAASGEWRSSATDPPRRAAPRVAFLSSIALCLYCSISAARWCAGRARGSAPAGQPDPRGVRQRQDGEERQLVSLCTPSYPPFAMRIRDSSIVSLLRCTAFSSLLSCPHVSSIALVF